jgi:4-amino-4-deoxy-L-arabinose transferase-like glycosyltransferase
MVIAIVAVGFILRVVVGLHTLEARGPVGDANWLSLTDNLLHGKGLVIGGPTKTLWDGYKSLRPPLFPILLAMVRGGTHESNSACVVFLAALSAGVIAVTFSIGRNLFGDATGLCAAAMAAFYPVYVFRDVAFMESGLFCLLTGSVILSLIKLRKHPSLLNAIAAGVLGGLQALTRGTAVPFLVLACLWFLVFLPCGFLKRGFYLTVFAGVIGVLLAPWLIRNHTVQGKWVYLTGSGRSLWIGNNESLRDVYPYHSIDVVEGLAWQRLSDQQFKEVTQLSEVAKDEWFRRRANDFIRSHPWETARNAMTKLGAAFSPVMNPQERGETTKYVVYSLCYGPILGLALCGLALARKRWRDLAPLVILAASFAVMSCVYWAHTRHRTFLDIYLMVLASWSLVCGWHYLMERPDNERTTQRAPTHM